MASQQEMTDWLGNKIYVGDPVIYATASGRSITMIIATVVKFNASGTITVLPVKSSRWKKHGATVWIDTRTDKKINNIYSNPEYIQDEARFRHIETGETLTYQQRQELMDSRQWTSENYNKYSYVPTKFKDFVKKTNVVKPVHVRVTDNVTKWQGDISTLDDVYDKTV